MPLKIPDVGEREQRFLDRLSGKYDRGPSAGRARSYLIAAAVIGLLFVLARWIPWWAPALVAVEAAGLALFHQYKRFASFKSRLLRALWRHLQETSK